MSVPSLYSFVHSTTLSKIVLQEEEMNESSSRMIRSGNPPSDYEIAVWGGDEASEDKMQT
jgi:hypothetical protein